MAVSSGHFWKKKNIVFFPSGRKNPIRTIYIYVYIKLNKGAVDRGLRRLRKQRPQCKQDLATTGSLQQPLFGRVRGTSCCDCQLLWEVRSQTTAWVLGGGTQLLLHQSLQERAEGAYFLTFFPLTCYWSFLLQDPTSIQRTRKPRGLSTPWPDLKPEKSPSG